MKVLPIAGLVLILAPAAAHAQSMGTGATSAAPPAPASSSSAPAAQIANPSQATTTGGASALGTNSGVGMQNTPSSPSSTTPNRVNGATGMGPSSGSSTMPGTMGTTPGTSSTTPGATGPH